MGVADVIGYVSRRARRAGEGITGELPPGCHDMSCFGVDTPRAVLTALLACMRALIAFVLGLIPTEAGGGGMVSNFLGKPPL
jgi:hypothetical protein